MTSDDAMIRARLATALDDVEAIETRPIEEVRAELQALGIDLDASIALAQKLARSAADPASRLLQQNLHAEDIDAEIAALEAAPLDEVKAALPPGIEASVTAAAQQRADRPSPVTDMEAERRRRRFSTLGWGGSLIGIAASVLLFIAVRPDQLEQTDQPALTALPRPPAMAKAESVDVLSEDREARAGAFASSSAAEGARLQQAERAERELDEADAVDAARKDMRSREPLEETAARPLADSLERARITEAPLDLASKAATSKAAAPPSPPLPSQRPSRQESDPLPLAVIAEPSTPASTAWAERPALIDAELPGLPVPSHLTAIVLVDAARAPSALRDLVDALPEDQLATRLDEAREQASGRAIVALIAFLRDGERVEAVLVENPPVQTHADPPAETVTGLSAFTERTPADLDLPEAAAAFELIELPSGR